MEDAHISIANLFSGASLFAVLDGHGGSEVAQYVSDKLPDIIKASPHAKSKQWKDVMVNAFSTMDNNISQEKGRKDLVEYFKKASHDEFSPTTELDVYKHVGCTACVALLADGQIIVANAGDSRCVMGKGKEAVDLSDDHKPNNDKEKARILNAKGFVEDNRVNGVLNLSRSFGDYEYKLNTALKPEEQQVISLPDVRIEKITSDVDFVVLACDGIWECWESKKVVDFVYDKLRSNPKIALSQIIDELFEKIISPDCNTPALAMSTARSAITSESEMWMCGHLHADKTP